MKYYNYRYLIYKLYTWALKKKSNTPIANVIFTLSFVHFAQLLTVYSIGLRFIPTFKILSHLTKIYVGGFMILFCIINYFLIYNKEKWNSYLEEFRNESTEQSKKGKILVLSYLIGSIVLFFITVILLFSVFRR